MTTITLGQQNPLVWKQTFPDPSVLDEMSLTTLRKAAKQHGVPVEYEVWDVNEEGEEVNRRTETRDENALRDLLADHRIGQVSRDVVAAVTTIQVSPDSTFVQALAEIERIALRHGDPPEWVDGDDQVLVATVARMFNAEVGTPSDVEDRYYTDNGPPGVGPEVSGEGGFARVVGALGTLMFAMAMWGGIVMMLRTNAGRDHQANVSFATASTGTGTYAAANYIGVTEDATSPVAGDTTLTSELAVEGFSRAQATYGHTPGTATVTLDKTFTMSGGTSRTLRHAGLFNAASTGTMAYKTAIPSPPTLVSGDQAALTWTMTL